MAVEEKSPRILIVRRDNIGDLACTTPLMDALRARYPTGRIAALVNTYNAEVLARNPALDAVYAYEKLKHRRGGLLMTVFETAKLMSRLRGERLDYVLVPSATPRALRIAASLRPKRVLASDPAGAPGRHEVERCFVLGTSLGVSGTPGPMRVFPDPEKVAELKTRLALGSSAVAVHISARRPAQRWPAERYAELVKALTRSVPVLLLWAPGPADDPRHPGDDALARDIAARADCITLPTPDLATLIAALSLVERVVCPDGGAMHIAAALGKPVVALFGDSPVERWRPWGVPHRVVCPPTKNLADLPSGPVVDAYAELAGVRRG
jgi:ADP-heptose:LPS heptosyltransferase